MEEDVRFLTLNWDVRGAALRDRIRRSCDILLLLVLGIGLGRVRFDRLFFCVWLAWYHSKHVRSLTVGLSRLALGTESCESL